MIAAVVLNFRTPDETLLAVKSLLASRRALDLVIVVNNGVDDGTRVALDDVLSKITYIDTGSNLGFSGGMNVGIRHARSRGADRILLVNSDVIVPPDAVEHLEHALESGPQVGIVGPVVLARSEPDRIATLGMSYAAATGRMRHRGTGDRASEHRAPAEGEVVDAVSGCLMLIKSEVFERRGIARRAVFLHLRGSRSLLEGRTRRLHDRAGRTGGRLPRRRPIAGCPIAEAVLLRLPQSPATGAPGRSFWRRVQSTRPLVRDRGAEPGARGVVPGRIADGSRCRGRARNTGLRHRPIWPWMMPGVTAL